MKLSHSLHVENTKHEKNYLLVAFLLHLTVSLSKRSYESFPARQTLQDNFPINEIGNAQFYGKLKYTCMQIWWNKI